jgi:hypothetical protein
VSVQRFWIASHALAMTDETASLAAKARQC